jgi:hypothetical protein
VAGENVVRVQGLNGLVRAFGAADKAIKEDLRDALMEAAQPVRSGAQSLASARIRNVGVGSPWARMRVGVEGRSLVYVAPVERGVKSRGVRATRGRGAGTGPPSFGDLMMDRAMAPALAQNKEKVVRRLEDMLDEVADVWERAHG